MELMYWLKSCSRTYKRVGLDCRNYAISKIWKNLLVIQENLRILLLRMNGANKWNKTTIESEELKWHSQKSNNNCTVTIPGIFQLPRCSEMICNWRQSENSIASRESDQYFKKKPETTFAKIKQHNHNSGNHPTSKMFRNYL